MSILVAVTDNAEGQVALEAAVSEATERGVDLVAVNLTSADLDTSKVPSELTIETVSLTESQADEVEQVLLAVEARPAVTLVVVGVRRRSPAGKAVMGDIAQRLILQSPLPVLSVKTAQV